MISRRGTETAGSVLAMSLDFACRPEPYFGAITNYVRVLCVLLWYAIHMQLPAFCLVLLSNGMFACTYPGRAIYSITQTFE